MFFLFHTSVGDKLFTNEWTVKWLRSQTSYQWSDIWSQTVDQCSDIWSHICDQISQKKTAFFYIFRGTSAVSDSHSAWCCRCISSVSGEKEEVKNHFLMPLWHWAKNFNGLKMLRNSCETVGLCVEVLETVVYCVWRHLAQMAMEYLRQCFTQFVDFYKMLKNTS